MLTQRQRPTTPAEMYERFYVPSIFRPLSRLLLEAAKLRPSEHVLDLACGTGILARQVAPVVGETGKVIGLDLRPAMLAVARALPAPQGAPVEWREGNAVALDLPAGAFDVVLCQQGLQFFADRVAALQEMKRVSKRGGRLVLAVWQGLERNEFFGSMAEVEFPYLAPLGATRAELGAPFSLGSTDELRDLFEKAGLARVEISPMSLDVSFPAERFVENMEFAYAAVMPKFAEDPPAFDAFVDFVTKETAGLLQSYRRGDSITFPMHTHLVTATA